MKRFLLSLSMTALATIGASAQTLLSEDFEDWTTGYVAEVQCNTTQPAEGWTIIRDEEEGSQDWWTLTSETTALAGKKSITAGGFHNYDKTKEDWLITPEVTLGDDSDYALKMLWYPGSKSFCLEQGQYDMKIKVQVSGTDTWDEIFSQRNEEDVENAGVSYPWGNWSTNDITVDLSAYKGKTIRVAFVWEKLKTGWAGNTVKLDNITIEAYNRITTPILTTQTNYYNFPLTWVGGQMNSDVITFSNTGVGTLRLKSVDGIDGTDFSTSIDLSKVALERNESYSFYVYYNPSLTGAASVDMTLTPEEGDPVVIHLNGKKRIMPDGYTLEGFEDSTFPPVGWAKEGNWRWLNSSFAGFGCTYADIYMEEAAVLTSPRLDLSGTDEYTVSFDYLDYWDQLQDDSYEPENYVYLDFSKDGGATWTTLFTNTVYNEQQTQTISLGTPESDSCYVRWRWTIPDIEYDVTDYESTRFFLDNVVLPPLYGAQGAPEATTPVAPADSAVNQANRSLTLEWNATQFATDYKVYLGSKKGTWDLLDGVSSEGATQMVAPRMEYSTTYYWQVVPTNSVGDATDCPVWSFTTMADQSISAFPYSQGFEDSDALPLGWNATNDGYTKWTVSKYSPYEGSKMAFATGSVSDTECTLTTPEIILPADKDIQVSFFWGNNPGVSLEKNETGAAQKTATEPDGNDAGYFEISDGGEWHTLSLISENSQYWIREVHSLADYKGKNVQLRWRYALTYPNKRRGLSLDNFALADQTDCQAYFNNSEWNAGEVNYNRSLSTEGHFSVVNGGTQPITVSSATIDGSHFATNIVAGTEIAANKVMPFDITFTAGTMAGDYDETLTVAFTNGNSITLPLHATTLAKDVCYFNFENDEHASLEPQGLKTVDVDKSLNTQTTAIRFDHEGEAFAFIVLNVDKNHADWRNVYPVSGDQCLAAFAPYDAAGEDWLISPQLTATSTSQFRFYGKSYGSDDEFNDFTPHYFTICVSTTGSDVADFTETAQSKTELPYDANGKFTEFTIDLSKWAGQQIYVGLKHTVETTGYVAFFDDLYYEHFEDASATSVNGITAVSTSQQPVYNIAGQRVAKASQPGLYIQGGRKVVVK